jgi:beta-N-acetylhexosaminidase
MLARRALAAFLLFLLPAYPARQPTKVRTGKVTTQKPASTVPASDRQWVQRWMRGMTVRDLAAQLIVITSYGEAPASRSAAFKEFVHAVRDLKVGGVIVVNRVVNGTVRPAEPFAMATFLNRLQRLSKIPLLVGADFERGASMRVSGTTKYPHLMAYGAAHDLALTRYLGAATAREARALGVQWVFAPVADVNNNPDNPIINIRSFGENAQDVAEQVKAFIEGARSDPHAQVLLTVKHFPGHGDTNVDSHMGLPSLPADRARMDRVELVPFKAAIAAGVDAVMTAHMAVPAIEKQEIPATVSAAVLTGLLRNDLNFEGLIVTDAMDMQGLTKQFPAAEASVRALQAGADVLLMPANPDEAIRGVVAAVNEGRLTRKRLEQSVTKVLAAKVRVGLHRNKLVPVDDISDDIDSPEATEKAQEAAEKALTLVKNERSVLPLKTPASACYFVLSESRYGQSGRKMIEEIQKRSKGARVFPLDPLVPQSEISETVQRATGCEVNVVAAFVSASAYRGNVALAGNLPGVVNALTAARAPVLLISLGNPYLLRSFPSVSGYMAAYSTTPTSETAAVKALFGEIPIKGRLPVSIPGIAAYGDGIALAR